MSKTRTSEQNYLLSIKQTQLNVSALMTHHLQHILSGCLIVEEHQKTNNLRIPPTSHRDRPGVRRCESKRGLS